MSLTRVYPFATRDAPRCRPAAVWLAAVQWLGSILVYALFAISWSWLCTFCMSQGFILSGRSGPHQPRAVFLTGVLLWAHLFFSSSVVVMRAMALFPLHLVCSPTHPAGAWRILSHVIQRTLQWFVLCGLIVAAIGMGVGQLNSAWRKLQLEIYLSSLVFYSFVTVVDQTARRLYRQETVEGLTVSRSRSRVGSVHEHVQSVRRTLHIAGSKLALLLALLVPVWYVQLISSLTTVSSNSAVVRIILASLLFKMIVQEAAKRYILSHRVGSARSMAALVSIPTVIVDTQIRIVFLRFQSVQATISSTLVMAAAELALRFLKVMATKRKIQRRRRQSLTVSTGTKSPEANGFAEWKTQLERHSVMELSAGMFAEYSAIGCSYGIMLFLGHHSQYSIGLSTDSTLGNTSISVLAFQIGVEVIVDYVSCVVELFHGVDLTSFYTERRFLFVFFLAITLLNINVSSTLYLAD